MRLFFSGSSSCDLSTLKRLMLLGNTLCFADRPSVSLGTNGFAGTVGIPSPFRQFDSSGQPVTVEVHAPPSGPAGPVYQRFIEADFSNKDFIRFVVDGLRTSDAFTSKMVQLGTDYGGGLTGAMMRDAILALDTIPLSIEPDFMGVPMGIESRDPQDYLKWIMLEASIETSVAQLVAERAEAMSVSDDPVMGRLLTLRTEGGHYSPSTTSLAPYLGVEFVKAAVPDEILQKLTLAEILDYRRATAAAYSAWQTELDRVAGEIDDVDASASQEAVAKKLATDLMPKVRAYKAEVANVTERFYGDSLKNVVRFDLPSMTIAYITGHGLAGAALAFATTAFAGLAAPTIQHILDMRQTQRAHAVSYIVNLTN